MLLSAQKKELLADRAHQLRIDSIRATTASKSGHPTSCLSAADIISSLFFHTLKFDVDQPSNIHNDRFILSKGHAIPVVYAAWKQLGVIDETQMLSLRNINSVLEGHPTPRFIYNEAATGSLGQGLSIACGMALSAKKKNLSYTTYVMIGDGEMAEGSNWEAAEFASVNKLDNLVGIIDVNRLGQSEPTAHDHETSVYAKRFAAFGWEALEIDGHDIPAIIDAFQTAKTVAGKPTMIIAKTYKGFGLPDQENRLGFHGKPLTDKLSPNAIAHFNSKLSESNGTINVPTTIQKPEKNELPSPHPDILLDLAHSDDRSLFMEKMATRKAFGYGLKALGAQSNKVIALDADVKNSTFSYLFEEAYPERFVQSYIAEQNMVGLATGLEKRGWIPFSSTFACFFSRAYDQIRMAGIGRNALRLAGSHVGVSIGEDGPSQMGLEDIAMMRNIPQSIVLYPSDAISAYKLCQTMANYHDGISYMRTTRAATPALYDIDEEFPLGKCKVIKKSDNDVACIVSAGITLHEALKAHEILAQDNIAVSIIDLYSIKPLDANTIQEVVKASQNRLITVEDHYQAGGIGEAVRAALSSLPIEHTIMAVQKLSRSGSCDALMADAGIDATAVVKMVKQITQ